MDGAGHMTASMFVLGLVWVMLWVIRHAARTLCEVFG